MAAWLCVAVGLTVTLLHSRGKVANNTAKMLISTGASDEGALSLQVRDAAVGSLESRSSLLTDLLSLDGSPPQQALGPMHEQGGGTSDNKDSGVVHSHHMRLHTIELEPTPNGTVPAMASVSASMASVSAPMSSTASASIVIARMGGGGGGGSNVNANAADSIELERRRCLRRAIETEMRWPLSSHLM
jgi:hypothetical protein